MIDVVVLRGAELLVWMQDHAIATAVVAGALLVPGLVCIWAARRGAVVSRQALTQIDQRLTHIRSAMELLTDTTESALQTAFARDRADIRRRSWPRAARRTPRSRANRRS